MSVDPEEIKAWIEAGLSADSVDVTGDGHHFDAVIVSEDFSGQNTLTRHRMVYDVLGDKMQSTIHALSLKTYTPNEYTAQQ